jgi:hypothetical protein
VGAHRYNLEQHPLLFAIAVDWKRAALSSGTATTTPLLSFRTSSREGPAIVTGSSM